MQKQQLKAIAALPSPAGTPMSLKSDQVAERTQSHPNSTSSCSSASHDDDSNSVSATGNSTTTRRQRSLSAHTKTRSKKNDELKIAKSNMVARVQLGLIGMVNSREVTAREKRLHPDERTYLLGQSQAQEGSILRPAGDDLQFRASPAEQQRRSKKEAGAVNDTEKSKSMVLYQNSRIINSDEVKRPQNPLVVEKTRANKVPQTQGTVFSNLTHHQNGRTRENSRDALAAGQLAALDSSEQVYGQHNSHQRDQSQPQIKRSKTFQSLENEREQQQNLKANASAYLFDRPVDETRQSDKQTIEQPIQQLVPKPQTAPAPAERQIKYLGLVIEKNDEQDLHEDDIDMYYRFRSLREEKQAFQAGKRNLEDGVFIQRQYFPVRERYIRIVKKCRRRVIESFEKRGGRDFRRTRNALLSVVDQQHRLSHGAQRLGRVQRSYQ